MDIICNCTFLIETIVNMNFVRNELLYNIDRNFMIVRFKGIGLKN